MKREIPWRTDENGVLLGVRHHDSYLSKLTFSEDFGLELELRLVDGGRNALALTGLHHLNIASFWNTPIIGHVFLWKIGDLSHGRHSIADSAWVALLANQANSAEGRRVEVARVQREWPEALLVHVTYSYGGEMAAVCDRVLAYGLE